MLVFLCIQTQFPCTVISLQPKIVTKLNLLLLVELTRLWSKLTISASEPESLDKTCPNNIFSTKKPYKKTVKNQMCLQTEFTTGYTAPLTFNKFKTCRSLQNSPKFNKFTDTTEKN